MQGIEFLKPNKLKKRGDSSSTAFLRGSLNQRARNDERPKGPARDEKTREPRLREKLAGSEAGSVRQLIRSGLSWDRRLSRNLVGRHEWGKHAEVFGGQKFSGLGASKSGFLGMKRWGLLGMGLSGHSLNFHLRAKVWSS